MGHLFSEIVLTFVFLQISGLLWSSYGHKHAENAQKMGIFQNISSFEWTHPLYFIANA